MMNRISNLLLNTLLFCLKVWPSGNRLKLGVSLPQPVIAAATIRPMATMPHVASLSINNLNVFILYAPSIALGQGFLRHRAYAQRMECDRYSYRLQPLERGVKIRLTPELYWITWPNIDGVSKSLPEVTHTYTKAP